MIHHSARGVSKLPRVLFIFFAVFRLPYFDSQCKGLNTRLKTEDTRGKSKYCLAKQASREVFERWGAKRSTYVRLPQTNLV